MIHYEMRQRYVRDAPEIVLGGYMERCVEREEMGVCVPIDGWHVGRVEEMCVVVQFAPPLRPLRHALGGRTVEADLEAVHRSRPTFAPLNLSPINMNGPLNFPPGLHGSLNNALVLFVVQEIRGRGRGGGILERNQLRGNKQVDRNVEVPSRHGIVGGSGGDKSS